VSGDVLALIPARGGSKSIPRKNLIELAGKPLIAWSILQALESTRITRVVVSTDDAEIAAIAEKFGADVPFLRPAEYAQDLSPDIDVFRHALQFLAQNDAYEPDMVVHLRPTGPVRRVQDIDAAIGLLDSQPEADAVRSVSLVHQTPYKMWKLTDDGSMEPLLTLPDLPDCQSRPRQMLPFAYWQNGYVDILRPRAVLEKHSMWGDRVIPFIVETALFDLDYPEDIAPVEDALGRLEQDIKLSHGTPNRHPV
jgi:CMP-N,N'-diacetyllegionaminic acid synthase